MAQAEAHQISQASAINRVFALARTGAPEDVAALDELGALLGSGSINLMAALCQAEDAGLSGMVSRVLDAVDLESDADNETAALIRYRFGRLRIEDVPAETARLLAACDMRTLRYLLPNLPCMQGPAAAEALARLTEAAILDAAGLEALYLYNLVLLTDIHFPARTTPLAQSILRSGERTGDVGAASFASSAP